MAIVNPKPRLVSPNNQSLTPLFREAASAGDDKTVRLWMTGYEPRGEAHAAAPPRVFPPPPHSGLRRDFEQP
ncbi:hypothetical protein T484DRAFT_1948489 [Baffinella frigidus]|nr:hypothetical protein T484DRAFT_1948489 [Cryptophyta sp. CCMP2293]